MYYYFSSSFPSAIKINGIFYGKLYQTVKHLRIDGDFNPLVEICPLNSSSNPVTFILDNDFFTSPPENTLVTDLKGGYLIKFTGNCASTEFLVIKQEKFDNLVATVFNENGPKISIETPNDFYAENLTFIINSAQITQFSLNQHNFLAVLLIGDKNLLLIYDIYNQIRKVFCREVSDFSVDNCLVTTEVFNDMAKHVVKSSWEFNNGGFERKNLTCTCSESFDAQLLNEKLLPYAFFEEVLVCGDYASFLSDSMKEHANKLKGFLGDFIGVMPPPKFRSQNEVGLIYPDGANRYRTEYYLTELTNGKICNIKKTD